MPPMRGRNPKRRRALMIDQILSVKKKKKCAEEKGRNVEREYEEVKRRRSVKD